MSALSRLEKLPDWPARMTAPVAAAYMGISENSFLKRFAMHGRREEGNVLWSRAQLDHLVAKQFALPQPSPANGEDDESWADFR